MRLDRTRRCGVLGALALLVCSAAAQPAGAQANTAPADSSAPAHPCARNACRQFDFWVGSWEVFNPDGKRVGRNTIRKVENACALYESWTSARGGTGSSINFYHPGRGHWVQTWFDGNGGVIELEGELRDGAMHMSGTNFASDGTHELIRGTWTPLADGRVRQFFEQSRDDGATWYVWFDGYYAREAPEDADD